MSFEDDTPRDEATHDNDSLGGNAGLDFVTDVSFGTVSKYISRLINNRHLDHDYLFPFFHRLSDIQKSS